MKEPIGGESLRVRLGVDGQFAYRRDLQPGAHAARALSHRHRLSHFSVLSLLSTAELCERGKYCERWEYCEYYVHHHTNYNISNFRVTLAITRIERCTQYAAAWGASAHRPVIRAATVCER